MSRRAVVIVVPLVAVVGVLAFVLMRPTGDSRADGVSEPRRASDDQRLEKRDRTIDARFALELTGAVEAEFESSEMEIRVLTITGDPSQPSLLLLSVGPKDPIRLEDGRYLTAGFDLTNYRGDGDYTVRLGSPRALADIADDPQRAKETAYVDQSNVLIRMWGSDAMETRELPEFQFDEIVDEPCRLSTSAGGRRGQLQCSKVKDVESGAAVSISMRWG